MMQSNETTEISKRRERARGSLVQYAIEELKFLKSFSDLWNLYRKVKIMLPRVIGTVDRFHAVPPTLQIEPTNYCNADCICCPTSRSRRPRGYMDIKLFRRIIDDASELGVKLVFPFLHGEPMLHPRIVEMIRYIKSRGLSFQLVTNGVLLNRERIEGILGSGVTSADYVSFSILGATKEVHERIVQRANYNRVVKNVCMFLDQRRERRVNGPIIEAVFYTMPENEREKGRFIKKWRGRVDHVRLGGGISESFSEYKRDGKGLATRTNTCVNLWQKMVVFWNGDVAMCCQDVDGDWILGNLNEQSISEIWNSEELLAIKRVHKERQLHKIPLCYICDMW